MQLVAFMFMLGYERYRAARVTRTNSHCLQHCVVDLLTLARTWSCSARSWPGPKVATITISRPYCIVLNDWCPRALCIMAAQGTKHKPVLNCTMVGMTGDMMQATTGRREDRMGDMPAGGM